MTTFAIHSYSRLRSLLATHARRATASMVLLFQALPFSSFAQVTPGENTPSHHHPKLLLTIMVDQFRYDYAKKYRDDFHGGIDRVLRQGAVYEDAHQDHFPTLTSPGHATILTGSTPHTSGIIGNAWYDRSQGKQVTSVEDTQYPIVGETKLTVGASPHNLLVSTVADELKMAQRGTLKTVSISLKDVASILMVGRLADAAYWFDVTSGKVVSSTYYMQQLPDWVKVFNAKTLDFKPGLEWKPANAAANGGKPWMTLPKKIDEEYLFRWRQTRFANEALEELAEDAITNEMLGTHQATDVLAVSFSANDHLGHAVGPDAPEVRDLAIVTDQLIGKLIDRAEKAVGGRDNLLVVFSSDHGVVSIPQKLQAMRMPGGRVTKDETEKVVQDRLTARYGAGKWVDNVGFFGPLYLSHDTIEKKGLKLEEVELEAAAALRTIPAVADVYTSTELSGHIAPNTEVDRLVFRGYNSIHGPDLIAIYQRNYIYGPLATTHATPYNYDTHVPLAFYGDGIQAGEYYERVGISDVAPTVSVLLDLQMPNGSVGRLLPEVFASPKTTGRAVRRK